VNLRGLRRSATSTIGVSLDGAVDVDVAVAVIVEDDVKLGWLPGRRQRRGGVEGDGKLWLSGEEFRDLLRSPRRRSSIEAMRLTALAVVLAIAACGSAHNKPLARPQTASFSDGDDDDDDDVVCKSERMTGTNMSREVCRTTEEIQAERNAAMDWEKHPRADPTSPKPKIGGGR
jgi:hypothetical protein